MRAALPLVMLLLSGGCNDLQRQLAREGAIRCAGSAAGAALGGLKADVAGALAEANWQERMALLAAVNGGAEAIRCAVQELLGGLLISTSPRPGMVVKPRPEVLILRERALQWLKENP